MYVCMVPQGYSRANRNIEDAGDGVYGLYRDLSVSRRSIFCLNQQPFTALFNNTRTLKLKAQPTNAFFAAVNQVFGGS